MDSRYAGFQKLLRLTPRVRHADFPHGRRSTAPVGFFSSARKSGRNCCSAERCDSLYDLQADNGEDSWNDRFFNSHVTYITYKIEITSCCRRKVG